MTVFIEGSRGKLGLIGNTPPWLGSYGSWVYAGLFISGTIGTYLLAAYAAGLTLGATGAAIGAPLPLP